MSSRSSYRVLLLGVLAGVVLSSCMPLIRARRDVVVACGSETLTVAVWENARMEPGCGVSAVVSVVLYPIDIVASTVTAVSFAGNERREVRGGFCGALLAILLPGFTLATLEMSLGMSWQHEPVAVDAELFAELKQAQREGRALPWYRSHHFAIGYEIDRIEVPRR